MGRSQRKSGVKENNFLKGNKPQNGGEKNNNKRVESSEKRTDFPK